MRCSHDDCPDSPAWHPAIVLRSRRSAAPRRAVLVHLGYCDGHRGSLTLATFLSDEGFTKLAKHVREAGKPAPDRPLTTLEWVPLGDELTDEDQQFTESPEESLAF